MSKGSRQRPQDRDRFEREFQRIFGKPSQRPQATPSAQTTQRPAKA